MNSDTAANPAEGGPVSVAAANLSSAEQHEAAARPADGVRPDRGRVPPAAAAAEGGGGGGETRVHKQHSALSGESDPRRPHAPCRDAHASLRREEGHASAAAPVREMSEAQAAQASSCSMDLPKKRRRRPSSGGGLDGEEKNPRLPCCSASEAAVRTHATGRGTADSSSNSSSNSSSTCEANAASSSRRAGEGIGRDAESQENSSHRGREADADYEASSVRNSASVHGRPSERNGSSARGSASEECRSSSSSPAADSREERLPAVRNAEPAEETGEPSGSCGADARENLGRASRGNGSSSSQERMKGSPPVAGGRSASSNPPMDCKQPVAADARGAGDREDSGREGATGEEGKSREELPGEMEGGNPPVSSFAWGLWPRPLAPSEALESPSLLLLAAAGKKFQTEEQAKAFLETLTEEHKQQLRRRHYRVATQMLHVPPFEPLPREKFRHEAPPVMEPGVVEHSALRSYTKKLVEQEKQLKALQLHDIVFTNLYTRLRDLFPERSDATLYRMCKITCALAKRQGLPRVLEPLRRKLEDARFGVARERRKMCTSSAL